MKTISWIGDFEGTGAWPTINRHLTVALENRGYTVLKNIHNQGNALTRLAVFSGYPVTFPNLRHEVNISYTSWEFEALPEDFVHELNQFDVNIAASEWTANVYQRLTDKPAMHCHHGFDPKVFSPFGEMVDFSTLVGRDLTGKKVLLWVGGTDQRHGFDIAVQVMNLLPNDYVLVAKQSVHYPAQAIPHERVFIYREDVPSLAPYYRSAYALLHTARAVGFSLPAIEALACGCPVITTPLPPLKEYKDSLLLVFAGDYTPVKAGYHHIYKDVPITWHNPQARDFLRAILDYERIARTFNGYRQRATARYHTWEAIAKRMDELISGL
jgi:glycosyltransferase involved in cell wall biosynthesis